MPTESRQPLTAPAGPVPIRLARILQDSRSVRVIRDTGMGGIHMDERDLRGLLDQVKAGALSRRIF